MFVLRQCFCFCDVRLSSCCYFECNCVTSVNLARIVSKLTMEALKPYVRACLSQTSKVFILIVCSTDGNIFEFGHHAGMRRCEKAPTQPPFPLSTCDCAQFGFLARFWIEALVLQCFSFSNSVPSIANLCQHCIRMLCPKTNMYSCMAQHYLPHADTHM